MIAAGHSYTLLSPAEEDAIHRNLLRIVSEVGLLVENQSLLHRVDAGGGRVDYDTQRVTFATDAIETFISSVAAAQPTGQTPTQNMIGDASIFYGHYLDPFSDQYLPMTVERAHAYFQVAGAMPRISRMSMLGCPFQEIPPALEPLYERYWAWRLGIEPGGSIHRASLCPYIVEMCQTHAAHQHRPLAEVFAATVYLAPPLKLGYVEAEQVAWCADRGLQIGIGGSMITGGATGPVTLAGMVTLTLAEGLLLALLRAAVFGRREWNLGMSVTAMDPRTAMRPYGRPDMAIANLMTAQMARRYGVPCSGHCGLSDAMRPSPQAAAQKVISALPTLLAMGNASIQAGLLGTDEVFSPVQLVIDNQLLSALGQFTHDYAVTDESIAADLIAEIGPGGHFLAEAHTVSWLRREVWEPDIWERRPFQAWLHNDGKTDLDRARDQAQTILLRAPDGDAISDLEIAELDKILARARLDKHLGLP